MDIGNGKKVMDIKAAGEKWLKDHPNHTSIAQSTRVGVTTDNPIPYEYKDFGVEVHGTPIIEEKKEMKPHKCPVCEGRGEVALGFYLSVDRTVRDSLNITRCRSCKGAGYIVL